MKAHTDTQKERKLKTDRQQAKYYRWDQCTDHWEDWKQQFSLL